MEPIEQTISRLLTEYLELHQMRKTPERYAVLKVVYQMNGHFTVDELYAVLEGCYHVSRATIYNVLDLLVHAGLVVRHTFGTSMCYEKCYGVRDFHYQVCTECGAVQRVSAPQVSAALRDVSRRRFHATHATVCIYGLCAKCQSRQQRIQKSLERSKTKKTTKIKR